MIFKEKKIYTKDGEEIIFRSPKIEDAEALLEYLRKTSAETNFILRYPEECVVDIVQEELFIDNVINSPTTIMIIAEANHEIAGTGQMSFNRRIKTQHRSNIGIALIQKYWNRGIGTAIFEEFTTQAKVLGLTQMELQFIEGNKRGQSLYEKMGFKIVSELPNAIKLKDGTLLKEYTMIKEL